MGGGAKKLEYRQKKDIGFSPIYTINIVVCICTCTWHAGLHTHGRSTEFLFTLMYTTNHITHRYALTFYNYSLLSSTTSVSSSDSTSAVPAPSSTFTGVTLSHTLRFWSRPRSSVLNPCYWSTTSDGQGMSPEWRAIAYQRLPCMANSPLATGKPPRNISKTASKNPSLRVMLITRAGPTWLRTVMPDATQSPKRLPILRQTGEMPKKTRGAEEKPELPQCCHTRCYLHLRTLLTDLPFPHRTDKSWVRLQTTWTTFINLFREAKPRRCIS